MVKLVNGKTYINPTKQHFQIVGAFGSFFVGKYKGQCLGHVFEPSRANEAKSYWAFDPDGKVIYPGFLAQVDNAYLIQEYLPPVEASYDIVWCYITGSTAKGFTAQIVPKGFPKRVGEVARQTVTYKYTPENK